jgi:hypothetical protein
MQLNRLPGDDDGGWVDAATVAAQQIELAKVLTNHATVLAELQVAVRTLANALSMTALLLARLPAQPPT